MKLQSGNILHIKIVSINLKMIIIKVNVLILILSTTTKKITHNNISKRNYKGIKLLCKRIFI